MGPNGQDMRSLHIDTDPGVDDAMAIAYAAALPDVELVSMSTVFGCADVWRTTRNALWLRERLGGAWPVSMGRSRPTHLAPFPFPAEVHGKEGLGDVTPAAGAAAPTGDDAAARLARSLDEREGEIWICALGPLTNLAAVLAEHPGVLQKAAGIAVMGGAVRVAGNITPHAEANAFHDPHALAAVLRAGLRPRLIGLDVTREVIGTTEDFAILASRAPEPGAWLADAARPYIGFYGRTAGLPGCVLHDPVAMMALTRPDLFTFETLPIAVTLEGEMAGRTSVSDDPDGWAEVATGIDAAAAHAEFFETIANQSPKGTKDAEA